MAIGTVEMLRDVSLDAPQSEVVCTIGTSGSGKSTLLRCINILVPSNSDSVKVEGQEVHDAETAKELITIREPAEEGMTCMLVTHEMGCACETDDNIYSRCRSVIFEHDPPPAFFASASAPRTRTRVSEPDLVS